MSITIVMRWAIVVVMVVHGSVVDLIGMKHVMVILAMVKIHLEGRLDLVLDLQILMMRVLRLHL